MAADEPPLHRSKRVFRAAVMAFEDMKAAASFEDFAVAWQSFLERLEKVWVRPERECQSIRNRFEPWQSRFKKLRKEDELLRYLHHARNVDQHTIEPTAANSYGGLALTIPPGESIEVEIDRDAGRITVRGLKELPRLFGPGYILLPFRDRGVSYHPPDTHLGTKLTDHSPIAIAQKGLAFYADYLRQVEDTFFPKSPAE